MPNSMCDDLTLVELHHLRHNNLRFCYRKINTIEFKYFSFKNKKHV